jgi:hypothetical protein
MTNSGAMNVMKSGRHRPTMPTKVGLPENRKRLKGLGEEKAQSKSFDDGWNAGFDAGFKAGILWEREGKNNADL